MAKANGLNEINRRMICTYAEAVFMLHRKGNVGRCEVSVLAYVFGRDTKDVEADLKRGMVQAR